MSVDLEEGRLTKDSTLARIPPFPPLVFRVLDLLSCDHPDVVPLVEAISSDPVFAAQLLRMANSPLFGLSAQVDSVHRAALKLGFIHLQSLVLAVATTNYRRSALPTEALEKCWRHTLASAVLCREMGRAASLPADRMYSFGLLHDIGRLGLLVAYPSDYDGLLQSANRSARSLLELESRRFGINHRETGRCLVERWNLPLELGVIAGHLDAPFDAPSDFLKVVRLACQLADALGYSVEARLQPLSCEEILRQLPAAAREQFTENPESLRQMIESTIEQDRALSEAPARSATPARAATPRSEPSGPPTNGASRPDPSPKPRRKAGPAAWDPGVILLAIMVVLVLVAGAMCLRNG